MNATTTQISIAVAAAMPAQTIKLSKSAVMKAAHAIQKAAAKAWNCSVREILFSVCLEMARAAETFVAKEKTMEIMTDSRIVRTFSYRPTMSKIEKVVEKYTTYAVKSKMWQKGSHTRIYLNEGRKTIGYLKVVDGKVEIWESEFTDTQDQTIETEVNRIISETIAADGASIGSSKERKFYDFGHKIEMTYFDDQGRFIETVTQDEDE